MDRDTPAFLASSHLPIMSFSLTCLRVLSTEIFLGFNNAGHGLDNLFLSLFAFGSCGAVMDFGPVMLPNQISNSLGQQI